MEWVVITFGVFALFGYLGRKQEPKEKAKAGRTKGREPSHLAVDHMPLRQSHEYRHPMSKPHALGRWVKPGEPVTIGAFRIDCGMIYLGGILPGQSYGHSGNCVVDPTCDVAGSGLDKSGGSMSYWPLYQRAAPIARRTYLDWLATGRNDPEIGIGYVFLFFYGLERRLFVENAISEAPTLIAEVKRLLGVYGNNGSFRGYATRFLEAAQLISSTELRRPEITTEIRSGYEIPMAVRAYLGRQLAKKQPLDAEDALLWVLSLPDTNLRTPAVRCFDELVALWPRRFAVRHPEGLKVTPPKTRLKFNYQAASGSFNGKIDIFDESGPLPDIAVISAPLARLRDLLSACTEELAPYSRLLGKNPEAKGTLGAAMLLPNGLNDHIKATEASKRFGHLFEGRNVAGTTAAKLAEALSMDITGLDKVTTGLANQIGSYLDYLGIGYEPDKRYGASSLRLDGHVVLFRAEGGGRVDADAPAFSAARAMVNVAALAAGADDRIDAGEVAAITNEIRSVPGLNKMERARLIAYASTLLKDTSQHRFTLQKLKSLDDAAKRSVAKSATSAILADGHASPAEVKFLERLYKAMGLPQDDVYASLHRGVVIVDEPVTVSPESRVPGIAIPQPKPPGASSGTLQIDHSRLARLQSETSAVSELLAGIFMDEEPLSPTSARAEPIDKDHHFPGLDAAHATLLMRVMAENPVDRETFDGIARDLRLLPDGAIERINDWGFDEFDESIIDGDDLLAVAPHILTKLTEAEAAQ